MFLDLVKYSRSYRGFDENRTISREELLRWVDCARFAPSSINRQPFQYRLVHTPEELAILQPLTGWARALPQMKLPHPGHCPTAFVVICQNTDWHEDLNRYIRDVGAVAQTMLLAAASEGLGGIMIGNFKPEKVHQALALPQNLVPMLIVAFGKPDETVVIREVEPGADLRYYRDENDIHYVPKRRLEDIVL